MEIQEALTLISSLQAEKTAILGKNSELIGKLQKFKQIEQYVDLDIPDLIRIKAQFDQQGNDLKNHYESTYETRKQQLEQALETRLTAIEQARELEVAARESERKQLLSEKTKASAIGEFSKPAYAVFNPGQLYQLVGDRISYDETTNTAKAGETDLATFVQELRKLPEYQNQFKASGVSGSGSNPNTGSVGDRASNPWKQGSVNLTEQTRIFRENPALAQNLIAAAKG